MAVPTSKELESKREQLIVEFEGYCAQVQDAFNEVTNALRDQRYAEACNLMSTISAHQGQASVNMRTVLVKNGMIVRDRSDD
jgi:vacuolar-type H+-ATPase subunit D/Vma8